MPSEGAAGVKAWLGLQGQPQRWLTRILGTWWIFGERPKVFAGRYLRGLLERLHDVVTGFL